MTYIELISQEPLHEMIKQGEGYLYIPKSILQRELRIIYNGLTMWTMLRDTVSKNGLWGTGSISVKHPETGDWLYYTGTASIPHLKVMRLNYPNLEAHAFINACKKIGPWFGQNLNLNIEDAPIEALETENVQPEDIEMTRLKKLVMDAPTQEAANEIINKAGGWKLPLQFQTKELVNSKPIK